MSFLRVSEDVLVYFMGGNASISRDYWGDKKKTGGLGTQAGSRGGAPVKGLGDFVPQNLKLFCETTHRLIFVLKYNKQQLLSLDSTS